MQWNLEAEKPNLETELVVACFAGHREEHLYAPPQVIVQESQEGGADGAEIEVVQKVA